MALVAAAHAAAAFPESLGARALSAWLWQETDIHPEQVVAVSRTSVAAIVGGPEDRAGVKRVTVRSEAIDPNVQLSDGMLSTQVDVYVDCAAHKARQGATTGHEQRNLAGIGRIVALQESDWREPLPGTQLESVWRAVCDPGFQPPLRVAALEATPASASPPPVRRPATNPSPANPRLRVQVGAFPTAAEARAAAETLKTELPQLMSGRRTEVVPVQVGATAYFRVLVSGFSSGIEQAGYCMRLKASGHDCFLRNAVGAGRAAEGGQIEKRTPAPPTPAARAEERRP